ncbi:glutamate--cysteine ligase [Actinosynnema sp. NPDC050436]|uniref:carboxylate-amine ligase n=1 Tax=Actinosynnema sp. NPDC050436 TaxID=3155659 RepID=UPI003406C6EE
MVRGGRLTVGVEEEYLVVDPVSRAVRPDGPRIAERAADVLGGRVGSEFTRFQVETRTDPHDRVGELGEQIDELRTTVAHAAAEQGLRVVSSGSPVLGEVTPPPVTDGSRYTASSDHFRALDDEQSVCACHVHVGLADRAQALRVSNHLRPWLPALVALAANSPYWAGRDTGYASWRAMTWARWPAAGAPPYFRSPGHYDDLVGRLRETGAIMDSGGVYWDVRPSHHVPTLEVRVADAATTTEEAQLCTALVRALTDTALDAIAAGEPDPTPGQEVLRAACWRAARDGLTGHVTDPRTERLVPVQSLVADLVSHTRTAAERYDDHHFIEQAWQRLREHGGGADRQRSVHRRHRRLADVVDHLTITTQTRFKATQGSRYSA